MADVRAFNRSTRREPRSQVKASTMTARHDGLGAKRDARNVQTTVGSILAGAVVLAIPAIVLFVAFQKQFVQSNLGSGVKG